LTTTSIEVIATTATGAAVDVLTESGAAAMDIRDSSSLITRDGPAEFPFGTTVVKIRATDASGNFDEKEFSVKVLTSGEIADDLIGLVENLDLQRGITNSLVASSSQTTATPTAGAVTGSRSFLLRFRPLSKAPARVRPIGLYNGRFEGCMMDLRRAAITLWK
jgi:hypothetical protein